jgi:tripartite-type tricarboxylate transporter receptor subunit TctC
MTGIGARFEAPSAAVPKKHGGDMATRRNRIRLIAQVAGLALACAGLSGNLQACASRFIKVIVPNPAGGVGDLIARMLSERTGIELGQSMVVENRAGAATVIGTEVVANARPDGCTILSLTASGIVVSVLQDRLPYNLERDFAPIIGIGSFPMALAVSATAKTTSFAELVATARGGDGLTYASGGAGTLAHLSSVRLLRDIAGKGTHVPYRGNADAIQALVSNNVQLFFPSTAEALPLVKGGKLRLLAIVADERFPSLPEVPTLRELGLGEFNPKLWYGFLAPAGTPAALVARLYEAYARALRDPGMRDRLAALGFRAEIQDPVATGDYMRREAVRWTEVIRDSGITAN